MTTNNTPKKYHIYTKDSSGEYLEFRTDDFEEAVKEFKAYEEEYYKDTTVQVSLHTNK